MIVLAIEHNPQEMALLREALARSTNTSLSCRARGSVGRVVVLPCRKGVRCHTPGPQPTRQPWPQYARVCASQGAGASGRDPCRSRTQSPLRC